jgi:arylsulfatase A-like enzyme
LSPALLESALVAYSLGAVLGVAALLVEQLSGFPSNLAAGGAYSMAGGLLACGARWLLGLLFPSRALRLGTFVALGTFALLHMLYFVNVRVLPGENYRSLKSLAADLPVVGGVFLAVWWLARADWAVRLREAWGRPLAVVGAGCLMGALAVDASRWPGQSGEPVREGTGPNVVLVVIDSARRDHMGLYGYARGTTPALDALSVRARVYETAYAGSSWTVPSVAGLLNAGRASGVASGPSGSLPRLLADRGYVTGCFTDNPHLARGSDLVRDFDRVERSVGSWRWMFAHTVLGEVLERLYPGDDRGLVETAERWARRQRGPVFLYAHLMDDHTPYRSPPIHGLRRKGRRIEFPFTGMPMTPAEAEDIVARYDGGLRSADVQTGRLLTAAAGWGRPFLAIVTADHGESLGEEGRWFHGGTLAPELLAVPLLVLGEGVEPGRVRGPAGHASIVPTLLAAAGASPPPAVGDLRSGDGVEIVEGALPPYLSYRITRGFKVVVDHRNGRRRLFSLRDDSRELRDLAAEKPALAGVMAAGLTDPEQPSKPSPEQVERLRALGYVGS